MNTFPIMQRIDIQSHLVGWFWHRVNMTLAAADLSDELIAHGEHFVTVLQSALNGAVGMYRLSDLLTSAATADIRISPYNHRRRTITKEDYHLTDD